MNQKTETERGQKHGIRAWLKRVRKRPWSLTKILAQEGETEISRHIGQPRDAFGYTEPDSQKFAERNS